MENNKYKFLDKVKEILKEDSKYLEKYSEDHFANAVEFELNFVSLDKINELCKLFGTNDVLIASISYHEDCYSMIELEFNNVEFKDDKRKDTSFKGEF